MGVGGLTRKVRAGAPRTGWGQRSKAELQALLGRTEPKISLSAGPHDKKPGKSQDCREKAGIEVGVVWGGRRTF